MEFTNVNKKLMDITYIENDLQKKKMSINFRGKVLKFFLFLTFLASIYVGLNLNNVE